MKKHQAGQFEFSRKCVVCGGEFEVNGNFNKNKQLTCRRRLCQRALKTMKQSFRRALKRQKKGVKK